VKQLERRSRHGHYLPENKAAMAAQALNQSPKAA